jgi:hypothetical protein
MRRVTCFYWMRRSQVEVDRLEKLTGKAAKPPAAGGGDKKLTAEEWLAEELKKGK